MSQYAIVPLVLATFACERAHKPPAHEDPAQRSGLRAAAPKVDPQAVRALVRCFPEDASGDPPRPLDALLDRAALRYDKADFTGSLACAEEGARVDPRSVEAHHDRAAALEEL